MQTNGLIFLLGGEQRLLHLLVCLDIEPPLVAIRRETDFAGVWRGVVHKLLLYEDEILLFVSNNDRLVPCPIRIINFHNSQIIG